MLVPALLLLLLLLLSFLLLFIMEEVGGLTTSLKNRASSSFCPRLAFSLGQLSGLQPLLAVPLDQRGHFQSPPFSTPFFFSL